MTFYRQLHKDSREREIALIEAAAGMAAAAASMLKAEKSGNTMMYEINRDILRREVKAVSYTHLTLPTSDLV